MQMVDEKCSDTFDPLILILHPASAPCVINSSGALEFEEDALVLPMQKKLKDAMVRVLNDFANFRQKPFSIESRLRVESHDEKDFPATHVVRLVGSEASSSEVMVFRAAAKFILGELIPQKSIGEQTTDDLLDKQEKSHLKKSGSGIAAKFGGQSISQGFVVKFGTYDDLDGVAVQGQMPALELEQSAYETIEGVGRPMGFDEQKSIAFLWFIKAGNNGDESPNEGRFEVLCHNWDFLRTLAQAYVNRNIVEFRALKQSEPRKKKSVITLLDLREIAADELDQFQLK